MKQDETILDQGAAGDAPGGVRRRVLYLLFFFSSYFSLRVFRSRVPHPLNAIPYVKFVQNKIEEIIIITI